MRDSDLISPHASLTEVSRRGGKRGSGHLREGFAPTSMTRAGEADQQQGQQGTDQGWMQRSHHVVAQSLVLHSHIKATPFRGDWMSFQFGDQLQDTPLYVKRRQGWGGTIRGTPFFFLSICNSQTHTCVSCKIIPCPFLLVQPLHTHKWTSCWCTLVR